MDFSRYLKDGKCIIAMTGHTNIEKAIGCVPKAFPGESYLPRLVQEGQVYDNKTYCWIYKLIQDKILYIAQTFGINVKDVEFVCGMARGIDEIFGMVGMDLGCKLHLSIPNSIGWHQSRPIAKGCRAQAVGYDRFLAYPNKEIYEIKKDYRCPSNPGKTYPYANFARNQHMVDISTCGISFRSYKSPGSDDCIKRMKEQDKYLADVTS